MLDRSQRTRAAFAPGPDIDELLELCTGQAHREVLLALDLPSSRARGGLDVTSLNGIVCMDMGQLSRFLRRLEAAGLVCCRRAGKHHVYALTDRVVVTRTEDAATLTVRGESIDLALTLPRRDVDQLQRAVFDAQLKLLRPVPLQDHDGNGHGRSLAVELKTPVAAAPASPDGARSDLHPPSGHG